MSFSYSLQRGYAHADVRLVGLDCQGIYIQGRHSRLNAPQLGELHFRRLEGTPLLGDRLLVVVHLSS